VFEPKESIKNPVAEGIVHVVGLEHIESGDIHLRRSASIEEGTTFTKKFGKGDVLFGRRRAYLKKAAKANFEGICSGDITVMRVKEELLIPELLPFIVKNENFFDHAITHSAGGLSPRVKFKDLANYEFLLPPREQQAKIAELLWALDESSEKNNALKYSLEISYLSLLNSIFEKNTSFTKLKEIKINYFKGLSANEDITGESMLIPSGGVFPRFLKKEKIKKVNISNESSNKKILCKDDILFNTGGKGTLGRSHFFNTSNGNFYCDTFVLVIRVNDDNFLNKYIYHVFQSNSIFNQITKYTKGTTGITSIATDSIKNFEIPALKKETQKQFVKRLDSIETTIENLNHKIDKEKVFKNSIIKTIF
jgi:type I restriction enzyme S subunit